VSQQFPATLNPSALALSKDGSSISFAKPNADEYSTRNVYVSRSKLMKAKAGDNKIKVIPSNYRSNKKMKLKGNALIDRDLKISPVPGERRGLLMAKSSLEEQLQVKGILAITSRSNANKGGANVHNNRYQVKEIPASKIPTATSKEGSNDKPTPLLIPIPIGRNSYRAPTSNTHLKTLEETTLSAINQNDDSIVNSSLLNQSQMLKSIKDGREVDRAYDVSLFRVGQTSAEETDTNSLS